MTATARRVVRTLLQAAVAAGAGLGTLVASGVVTAEQAGKVGAVLTVLTGVVTAAWNGFEDASGKTLLVRK